MAGPWRVKVSVQVGNRTISKNFDFEVGGHGGVMPMSAMKGRFGDWGMQRESSGTAWIPESSPMFMKMLPNWGRFEMSAMGFVTANFSDAGGPRGDSRSYSNSMLMVMARSEGSGGILGFSVMASLDPIFNGEFGYPNLFQTGETAYGQKLVDYQHPHDLIAEAAVSYSRPLSNGIRGFVYGGPAGEPALGGPTFMHRPSGMEIPEAPVSHHWFDSTHITWGVVTLGVNSDRWQVEGSFFNGHEPDENRYSPDPLALNSASGRITFNPTKDLSFNASFGYLNSPESTEPGVDQHRLTLAALWNKGPFSFAGLFGRNLKEGTHSDALVAEGSYLASWGTLFGRWEHVDKDELEGVPPGSYKIDKVLLGGVWDFGHRDGFDLGIGGYVGFYGFPSSLEPFYGRNPMTMGAFLRLRPSRM